MKQLLIIVYKISVAGLTRAQTEEGMSQLIESYSLRDDEELKDRYIIREIFLPLMDGGGETDVKVIYPVQEKCCQYTISSEINELVAEISNKIKEDPTNQFKNQWERLVRELKLRNLKLDENE